MLNIGIIGPGNIAERHASTLSELPDAQLWSVGSRRLEDARDFAEKHKAAAVNSAFEDLSLMLKDPQLDAVIIASPDNLHVQHILLAANAGKHIFVEKPVCTSLEFKEEMIKGCQEKNIILAIGYHLRWHQGLRKIAKEAASGALGEIRHLRLHWAINFLERAKWRVQSKDGWCCLSSLGTHLIDIMRWMMVPSCGEVIEIKSFVKNNKLYNNVDDTILTIVKFESGATSEIFCSVTFDSAFTLEMYADQKNVLGLDLLNDNRRVFINGEPMSFEKTSPYIGVLNDFVDAIVNKRPPEVTLLEGLRNVEHLIAIDNQKIK